MSGRGFLGELSFFVCRSVRCPKVTGTQIPTWKWLARNMVGNTDVSKEGGVVELGAGTGAITRALFERGFTKDRVCTVELSGEFAGYCRERFPGLTVLEASAFDLEDWREKVPFDKVQAVVSSLPLAFFEDGDRIRLIKSMLGSREEGGLGADSMSQMAYFAHRVVKKDRGLEEGLEVKMGSFTWLNVYPAATWYYSLLSREEEECLV